MWTTTHPSNRANPLRCLQSLLQPEWCLGLLEGKLWSLCPAGSWAEGQGTGRDEPTYAEHHQFSSKAISIMGSRLLQESHPIHHRNCLDVTLPARAWPLSPKSPQCAVQQLHSVGRGPVPLPDFTEPAPSHLSGFAVSRDTCASTVPLQPLLRKNGQGRKDVLTALLTELQAGPEPPIACTPPKRGRAWAAVS